MAHDVFITYSSKDKEMADAVCAALEASTIQCWYAPRNIRGGASWTASIMDGLANSRIMILIWSANSNASRHVTREVQHAFNKGITVIPFRIEDVAPTKELEYYLESVQWLVASTPPLEDSLKRLVEHVQTFIPTEQAAVQSDEQIQEENAEEALAPERLVEEEGSPAAERANNEQYVDMLISNTGVSLSTEERDALVAALSNGTMTRAEVLRQVEENNESTRVRAELAQKERAEEVERHRLEEEQRKAEEAEGQRADAEAVQLAEATARRAEEERERAAEEARVRAAEESRIRAAEETDRLAQKKRAEEAEAERVRLQEEQRKADELARQREEAEARLREEAQAAISAAELQRELKKLESEGGEDQSATPREMTQQPQSARTEPSRAVDPVAVSALNSYESTANQRFSVRRVAITVAVILIAVAGLAFAFWPKRNNDQNQPSKEALAGSQTPTPEPTTSLSSPPVESKSGPSPGKASPTPRKGPTPERSPTVVATEPPPAPTRTPPRAPISGGVLNGKAISLPKPAYPAIARQAHASGTVVVQVTIDENGSVISAHAVSGHPLLQAAAVVAARQARFSPTKLSGQPVKVTGVITYNFVAQ